MEQLTIADDLMARMTLDMAKRAQLLPPPSANSCDLRSEADTTGVLLILRVVKTLLHG